MRFAGTRIYRYSLPLCRPMTVSGDSRSRRDGLLLRLTGVDGAVGWGDAAPLPGFSRETLAEAFDALKCAAEALCTGAATLWDALPPSASFAIETALDNIAQRTTDNAEIMLSALLAGKSERILEKARRAASAGFRTVKLKVGRSTWADEAALAAAVRETVGPGVALRLDANRAWDLDTAVAFARAVSGLDIAYIEEPLHDWRELRQFHEAAPVPFSLDETLQEHRYVLEAASRGDWPSNAQELHAVIAVSAACVIKPTLLHFHGLREWLLRASLDGKPVVISAAFESGVGIAALAGYAARLSTPGVAAGLDTYAWLAEDVLCPPLSLHGGAARRALLQAAATCVDTTRLEALAEYGDAG